MRSYVPRHALITKVNVTPIIDVALVLVIILLVTAPLLSVADLPVNLPQAQTRESEDERNLSITLSSKGELALDDDLVTRATLGAALRERLSQKDNSNVLVVVRADSDASYAAVRDLLEAARAAGARRGAGARDPLSPTAIVAQRSARLSKMPQEERRGVRGTASTSLPSSMFGTNPATIGGTGVGTGSSPVALHRGGNLGGAGALPLSRGSGPGTGSASAPATLPASKTGGSAPAQVGDATARRTIAGASVAGPIADRPVLQTVVPEYPEWAKKEAVEGSVTLYFVVRSDGTVKENVVIQKTAGFGDFDEN